MIDTILLYTKDFDLANSSNWDGNQKDTSYWYTGISNPFIHLKIRQRKQYDFLNIKFQLSQLYNQTNLDGIDLNDFQSIKLHLYDLLLQKGISNIKDDKLYIGYIDIFKDIIVKPPFTCNDYIHALKQNVKTSKYCHLQPFSFCNGTWGLGIPTNNHSTHYQFKKRICFYDKSKQLKNVYKKPIDESLLRLEISLNNTQLQKYLSQYDENEIPFGSIFNTPILNNIINDVFLKNFIIPIDQQKSVPTSLREVFSTNNISQFKRYAVGFLIDYMVDNTNSDQNQVFDALMNNKSISYSSYYRIRKEYDLYKSNDFTTNQRDIMTDICRQIGIE